MSQATTWDGVPNSIPMKFRAYAKNLRILIKTPFREVQNGIPIEHAGEYIQFERHYYETEDERILNELKNHKSFCETPDTPGGFWIYVEPVNFEKKATELEAENAALRERLAKLEKKTPAPKAVAGTGTPAAPSPEEDKNQSPSV